MLSRRLVAGVYAAVGALGATGAIALGYDPLRTRAWLSAWVPAASPTSLPGSIDPSLTLDLLSLAMGVALAGLAVVSARVMVARYAWARALHAELAPVVRGNSDRDLLVIALASGIAEELLFRGLGVQLVGVIGSSILFGLLHQVRGPARFAWMSWAAVMGLFLGLVFVATGSLLGPVVAHVMTNAINLRFVRDYGRTPGPRPLSRLVNVR